MITALGFGIMSGDVLVERLQKIVGASGVLTDPALTASYTTDFTGGFGGPVRLVVRPGDTAEVAEVVRACAADGVPIIPQGGNTGLVGGGVPAPAGPAPVVLSLTRLTEIGPVDPIARQITVGAGVPLATLRAAIRDQGLDFGVDLAARDSATIGGMIATNAGGERVLRHGTTRACVAGIEAVLPDGQIIDRLAGLPKDNTGFDLTGLLAGSEGTLAVITRARLKLTPQLDHHVAALLALDSIGDALTALVRLRELPSLELAEFFFADGLDLVRAHASLPAPFRETYATYLLVECAGRTDPSDELMAVLEELDTVRDAAVAMTGPDRRRLAAYRELHTESINAQGVPLKLDVTVPMHELERFLADVRALVEGRATPYLFGHLAEGNIHVNLIGAADPEALADEVLHRVAAVGGSISAEHGVGRAKTRWLGLSRSAAEISAMRAVKSALDPQGILNPGVIFSD
jgi:FAD/FMN-containing dehydrogenase